MAFTLILAVIVNGAYGEIVLANNLSAIECEEKAIQFESLMDEGDYELICAN